MRGKPMSNLTAAEILLGIAVLVLAMPREDGFILPERRDWTGWLKRLLPKARRRREEEAGREADRYVTDLRTDRDQPLAVIRQDQLPSTVRKFRTPLLSPPTEQKPPWKTAENPAWNPQPVPLEKPRRRAPHDPPTVVIEIMRPAVEGDLGHYLAELPAYTDDSEFLFVPRSTLALDDPDHHGAPGDDDDAQREAEHLGPGEFGAGDPEVEVEDIGQDGHREG